MYYNMSLCCDSISTDKILNLFWGWDISPTRTPATPFLNTPLVRRLLSAHTSFPKVCQPLTPVDKTRQNCLVLSMSAVWNRRSAGKETTSVKTMAGWTHRMNCELWMNCARVARITRLAEVREQPADGRAITKSHSLNTSHIHAQKLTPPCLSYAMLNFINPTTNKSVVLSAGAARSHIRQCRRYIFTAGDRL